jgi:hypothetical protein
MLQKNGSDQFDPDLSSRGDVVFTIGKKLICYRSEFNVMCDLPEPLPVVLLKYFLPDFNDVIPVG